MSATHAETIKNLKPNLFANLMDGAFFGMAMGFASTVTVLPLFVSTLTDSALLIGLIPAIHSVGWQLPQLFTAGWVSRQRRYKPLVLMITIHERLPFLGLAILAWFLPSMSAKIALLITFILLVWQGLGGGLTANAWQSMIAKIFPANWRGTFFGAQGATAHAFLSLAAVLAGLILETRPSPLDYTLCFLFASIGMLVSWLALALTRETEHTPPASAGQRGEIWKQMGAILRRDSNFRSYLGARMLAQLAVMGFAFYSVYAVSQHGVSEIEIGWMTGVLSGVQILANPLMGWLGDHWSNRGVMLIGVLAATLSAALAWQADGPLWFYPVFVLAGVANVALWTISISMTMQFGVESQRPAYIGMANTLVAPANILAPLLGGWLADAAGYPAAFLASALSGLATLLVFHFLVKDP